MVDTIGFNDKTYIDNYLTPHTTRLHVVERFTLGEGSRNDHPAGTTAEDMPHFTPGEGGKVLEVSITVDDPGTFTHAWTGVQVYRLEFEGDWEETICGENNATAHFQYENDVVPIPQSIKPDF